MKITNNTDWRTEHLRAFIHRVAQEELDAEERRKLWVTVDNGRKRISGRLLHSYRFRLMLPRMILTKPELARVIAWLIAYSAGMRKFSRHYTDTADFQWTHSLPLDKKPVTKPDTRADKLVRKHAHAAQMVKSWERKVKLAQTMLKKWLRREKALIPKATAAKLMGAA